MLHTRTFPRLQKIKPFCSTDKNLDPHTLQAIHAYTDGLTASVASYTAAVEALLAQYSAQTSALLTMQQQFIIDKEAQHQQQSQDLIDSFQRRYEYLQSNLTAEQVAGFRSHITEAHPDAGLDLWDHANGNDNGSAPTFAQSIQDFICDSSAEENHASIFLDAIR